MKRHSLLVVIGALMVLMLLISGAGLAQEAGTYQGVFTFNYPSDWTATVGGRGEGEQVQVTKDNFVINVYGPDAYAQIIASQTFADNGEALAFFADRAGYEAGDAAEPTGGNELARLNVSLPRRDQVGLASLIDLQNGRTGVIVALNEGERLDINLVQAFIGVLSSFNYPPDIVDIASSNPDFSTLVAAVQAAGLVDTLKGEGPFTVFAPTNAAFLEALETLGLTPEAALADTATLTTILTYHVVPGAVTSDMLANGPVTTVQGDPIRVNLEDGVKVNDATVVAADIIAGNGVVHVIDKVLLPPDIEATLFATQFQELLKRNDSYSGRFNVQYAKGINLTEGKRGQDLLIFSKNDAAVTFYGPDTVASVFGTVEFADNAERLAFFLERNSLEAGDVVEPASEKVLAAQAISLPRRGQSGTAYLVDLSNGRIGIVTALAGRDGFSIALRDFAANQVINTLDYPGDLVDVVLANPDFSILGEAVVAAGLVDTLREGEFTIFAPTNDEFAAILGRLQLTKEALFADTELLTAVLTYHVIPGVVAREDLAGFVASVNGKGLRLSPTKVNNANIIESAADIAAFNGVIHTIDGVLVPSDYADIVDVAASNENYSILVEAIQAAGLEATLRGGEFTVFAPTNDEFAALLGRLQLTKEDLFANTDLLTAVLTYHVVPGVFTTDALPAFATTANGKNIRIQGEKVNNVNIVENAANIETFNGIIHTIDGVLLPDEYTDIIDVAASNPSFSLLVEAIQTAGLEGTLRSGEFTVFAPTNDVFLALLGRLNFSKDDLFNNVDLLTAILTYHVVPGTVTSADLANGAVATVNGQSVTINVDARPKVNQATVIIPDIAASNGVIHAINGVLVPPVLCFASTDVEKGVEVLVNPGSTLIAFLPTGTQVDIVGQFTTESGELWYKVNKFQAAPNNANDILAAWVLASSATISGPGCGLVAVTAPQ
jgi:transforming growth factor-beta-induced protein